MRWRTAGAARGREPAEMERAVTQLRAELDAIADALDEVSRATPAGMPRELGEAPAAAEDASARGGVRARQR